MNWKNVSIALLALGVLILGYFTLTSNKNAPTTSTETAKVASAPTLPGGGITGTDLTIVKDTVKTRFILYGANNTVTYTKGYIVKSYILNKEKQVLATGNSEEYYDSNNKLLERKDIIQAVNAPQDQQ